MQSTALNLKSTINVPQSSRPVFLNPAPRFYMSNYGSHQVAADNKVKALCIADQDRLKNQTTCIENDNMAPVEISNGVYANNDTAGAERVKSVCKGDGVGQGENECSGDADTGDKTGETDVREYNFDNGLGLRCHPRTAPLEPMRALAHDPEFICNSEFTRSYYNYLKRIQES